MEVYVLVAPFPANRENNRENRRLPVLRIRAQRTAPPPGCATVHRAPQPPPRDPEDPSNRVWSCRLASCPAGSLNQTSAVLGIRRFKEGSTRSKARLRSSLVRSAGGASPTGGCCGRPSLARRKPARTDTRSCSSRPIRRLRGNGRGSTEGHAQRANGQFPPRATLDHPPDFA